MPDVFCDFRCGGIGRAIRCVCARCGKSLVVFREPVFALCKAASRSVDISHLHGPGTELSKLLKRFGVEPTPTCACRAKANEMDAWGCDECSKAERIEEVVAVMLEEAKARGLPFVDMAGRMLVRRAIANARKAEARRAKEAEAAAAKGRAAV
jgi:hypothetical protein